MDVFHSLYRITDELLSSDWNVLTFQPPASAFFCETCAIHWRERIELPLERAARVIEQQEPGILSSVTTEKERRSRRRRKRSFYCTFQFHEQYWRIITLPVRYLSTPSYRMQGNNYHILLQLDELQCKTTCRARCGFSSIGRFLRFLSRDMYQFFSARPQLR